MKGSERMSINDIWTSIYSVIRTMHPVDFVDIALLSYLIYYVFKFIRETRAGPLFKGIVFLLVAYAITKAIELKAITYLLEATFDIGILAIMIIFQPEIRRAVEKLGHTQFGLKNLGFGSSGDGLTAHAISAVGGLLLCGGIVPRQIMPYFLCRIGEDRRNKADKRA